MPEPSPRALEAIAIEVAREAAGLVAARHGQARAIAHKSSPTDVVTETDVAAEELIRRRLAARTPGAALIGEERGASGAAALQWVIDPLDGTVNFLYGVPLFAISIAAAVEGEVVAGAVVDVLRDETFSAHAGGGARRNGEPIAPSACTELAQALLLTGFSYHAAEREQEGALVHRLLPRARDVRCFGSAALELCWVACGLADAYFQRGTELWDRAAGALIAAEAGATVELPCPENDDLLMVAARGVFDDLWAAIHLTEANAPSADT